MNWWKSFVEKEKERELLRQEITILDAEQRYLYFLWKIGKNEVKKKLLEVSAKLDNKLITLLEM